MLRMIRHRILISIPLVFVVSAVVFVLQSLIPGNAAAAIAGINASRGQIEALAHQMHLDQPIYAQYWSWLSGVFHGSLGQSLINGESVASALNTRLSVTLSLVGLATVASTLIGVVFGVLSTRGGEVARRAADVASVVGMAIPSFWLSLLLMTVFSVQLGWLPSNGYVSLAASPSGWARALVLPVAALALSGVTAVAKQTREALLDASSREYIRNLRANGIPEQSIIFKHCLRSAAVPVVTMSGILFINALGGAVVIEQIFGLPGLGSLAVSATSAHDIPMIQGVAIYFTLLVVAMNLILDIAYGLINPMVRTR